MNSSSGGFFTLLAEDVITLGGVVFGAKFDNDFSVVHDYTETIEGLAAFRGSKYVQSKIGNSYKDVKKFLDEGKNVLFTGTPCQIGGLKAFLNKEYEKLICIDIICHGVPSPKVWRKYVEFRENVAKSKAEKIIFRLKNCGWTRYSVFFGFANKTEYCKIFNNDLFMQVFLKDLCLRKSCHRCGFKTISRISDITIADFWGAQSIVPEMFDDKGISLVLVQSPKGRDIFNKIKLGTDFIEIDSEKALLFNPAAFRSCAEPLKRSEFMIDIDNLSFDKLVKKYTKVSLIKRAIFFVSLVLKKISKTMFKSDKK
jgi:coenzyme F420-reducing hydrogenase beta subunit